MDNKNGYVQEKPLVNERCVVPELRRQEKVAISGTVILKPNDRRAIK
jgi:hypothetical protein